VHGHAVGRYETTIHGFKSWSWFILVYERATIHVYLRRAPSKSALDTLDQTVMARAPVYESVELSLEKRSSSILKKLKNKHCKEPPSDHDWEQRMQQPHTLSAQEEYLI